MGMFVSLDIETLGLDINSPIIQFGAVVADWSSGEILGEFETNLRRASYDHCEPYAMSMHPKILREIADGCCLHINSLPEAVHKWLLYFGLTNKALNGPKIIVAGKNAAGFDLPRLRHQCEDWDMYVPCLHRVLDPGMMYWNPLTDKFPPDLKTCLERAGLKKNVAHTALADAIDVANLIIHYARNVFIPIEEV